MRVADLHITPARVRQVHGEWLARKGGTAGELRHRGVEDRLDAVDQAVFYGGQAAGDGGDELLVLAVHLWLKFTNGHVFVDGNKRVGWARLNEALACWELGIQATDDEAIEACLSLARGDLDDGSALLWVGARIVSLLPDLPSTSREE